MALEVSNSLGTEGRGVPRPITWWILGLQGLPIFNKRSLSMVTILDGVRTVDVYRPRRVILPLINFEHPPAAAIIEGMWKLIVPIVTEGRFYGVLQPNAVGGAAYGLCYSLNELTPDESIQELSEFECHQYGLPLWEEVRYTGPRPTRFEREDVI